MTLESREIAIVGGTTRAYIEDGSQDQPTLIMLHYWGGSRRTWGPVVDRLRGQCPIVTFDHRGWGDASALPGPYGLEQLADDVERIVAGLGIQKFVLVGHSMGGKVAQLVASRRPPGLAGVVLVAPAPPRPTVDEDTREQLKNVYTSEAAVQAAIDHVLTLGELTPDLRAQVVADSLAGNPQARLAWPSEGLTEDLTEAGARIDVPVLVLAGSDDRVDPPATLADHLLPFIGTASLEVLPETGHLSPLEVPHAVATAISGFIAGRPRRASDEVAARHD
ncbi:pimeloyl-ACP methyl ester carboxylesterase [Catenulispora sp. MAP12-49]|uniref:alpha/beta fold hydrolase n=1 Tax=Catenulispora sp. MAP12-49 TaxID=3156302 RepID=UPI0035155B72